MATIESLRKMKKSLEATILEAARNFENAGARISYINVKRHYPDETKNSMRPVSVDEGEGIESINVELKIDLD